MASASLPFADTNVISSLKPFCFRMRGRMSFSNVCVNSLPVLGLRWMDTFRVYIWKSLRCCSLEGTVPIWFRQATIRDCTTIVKHPTLLDGIVNQQLLT